MATLTKNEPNLFYTSHLSTIARKHNDQPLLVILVVRIRLLLLGILTINALLCLRAVFQLQPLLPLGEEVLVLSEEEFSEFFEDRVISFCNSFAFKALKRLEKYA